MQIHVGAGAGQHLDGACMVLRGRPHERRLVLPLFLALTLAPCAIRAFTESALPARDAVIRTVSPSGSAAVRIGAGFEQRLDKDAVSVFRREREGRDTISICGLDVRTRADEGLRSFDVVVSHRPMKRGHPVGFLRIQVGTLLQQRADRLHVAAFNRVNQARAVARRPKQSLA